MDTKERASRILDLLLDSVEDVLENGRTAMSTAGPYTSSPSAADWKFAMDLMNALDKGTIGSSKITQTLDQLRKKHGSVAGKIA